MNLEKLISEGIKQSMIQKQPNRLRALRGIKSQMDILNSTGKEVTEEMQLIALQKMVKQRKESAEIFKTNNREDLFQKEMEEISVIEEFLPKQFSREETELEVRKIVAEYFSLTMSDEPAGKHMGKLIGLCSKTLSGKADNKIISEIVKSILQ